MNWQHFFSTLDQIIADVELAIKIHKLDSFQLMIASIGVRTAGTLDDIAGTFKELNDQLSEKIDELRFLIILQDAAFFGEHLATFFKTIGPPGYRTTGVSHQEGSKEVSDPAANVRNVNDPHSSTPLSGSAMSSSYTPLSTLGSAKRKEHPEPLASSSTSSVLPQKKKNKKNT